MTRLDKIANWLLEDGEISNPKRKDGGWPGYVVFFRPTNSKYSYSGKISLEFKRKPSQITIIKQLHKEIKKRALDAAWYNNGLKRLIKDLYVHDENQLYNILDRQNIFSKGKK